MNGEEEMLKLWKNCEARSRGFTFQAFISFCREWDSTCKALRLGSGNSFRAKKRLRT